jgi:hypothetical protein
MERHVEDLHAKIYDVSGTLIIFAQPVVVLDYDVAGQAAYFIVVVRKRPKPVPEGFEYRLEMGLAG